MEQTIENFEGTKIVENNYGGESMGDVGAATIYLFACYALYLWLKKKIK